MKIEHKAVLATIVLTLIPQFAFASGITEQGGLMQEIAIIITGPVGKYLSIIAMALVGVTFIFKREEISSGSKSVLGIVFTFCLIVFASSMVENMFGFDRSLELGMAIIFLFLAIPFLIFMHFTIRFVLFLMRSFFAYLRLKIALRKKRKRDSVILLGNHEKSILEVIIASYSNVIVMSDSDNALNDFLLDFIFYSKKENISDKLVVFEHRNKSFFRKKFANKGYGISFCNTSNTARSRRTLNSLSKFLDHVSLDNKMCRIVFREMKNPQTAIEALFCMKLGFRGSIGAIKQSGYAKNAIEYLEKLTANETFSYEHEHACPWKELIGTSIDYIITIKPNSLPDKDEQYTVTQCIKLHHYNPLTDRYKMETIYENQA